MMNVDFRGSWIWPLISAALLLASENHVGVLAQETVPSRAGDRVRHSDGVVWPNDDSRANSDPWLIKNHDRIREMRPRLLVLNFVNGLSKDQAMSQVDALIACLAESSRYHGYAQPDAPAFLKYSVFKFVDLTDPEPLPASRRFEGNSSFYPRVPDWKEGRINFSYGELFTPRYTALYKVADPSSPARNLTLADMVDRGLVHEVWFLAKQGQFGAPFEATEVKQAYGADFSKLKNRSVQAGNGGSDEQPFIGRSLRILFINAERGPGCAMESLAHALEGMSNSNAIPYFTRYFREYAGFDLDQRYRLPFNSLYGRGNTQLSYPTPTSMTFTWQGRVRTLKNYIPIGGNAHFTPNGRSDYDLDNPAPVMSTIEHYRLRDGENGKDRAVLWTIDRFASYRDLANDCMGPWLVYWRQNMPGLDNPAKDDSGKQMKNWWPFLFY
jgi:hypothetical protein